MNRQWNELDYSCAWHERHVPRWTAVQTTRPQMVAEHEFGTLVIAKWLMKFHREGANTEFRLAVYEETLGHDREESLTGDLPTPNKSPADAEGASQVKVLRKCADVLEALLFLHEEQQMGNSRTEPGSPLFQDVFTRFSMWLDFFDFHPLSMHPLSMVVSSGELLSLARETFMPREGAPLLLKLRLDQEAAMDEEIPF